MNENNWSHRDIQLENFIFTTKGENPKLKLIVIGLF